MFPWRLQVVYVRYQLLGSARFERLAVCIENACPDFRLHCGRKPRLVGVLDQKHLHAVRAVNPRRVYSRKKVVETLKVYAGVLAVIAEAL